MSPAVPSILLVEDNETDRYLIVRMLEKAGHPVRAVERPQAALQVLEDDDATRVLITDIRLPEMSGFMLARAALVRRPELQVIYLTALSELPQYEADLAEGPILTKSAQNPERLLAEVDRALRA